MTRRDSNLIDKIASIIPGYRGYADRDDRKIADQRLREAISDELRSGREGLTRIALSLTDAGRLEDLAPIGRLAQSLSTSADTLRHAPQGSSGLMDAEVVRAEDLDRVHAHDLSVGEAARALVARLRSLTPQDAAADLAALASDADDLLAAIRKRGEIFREVC